MEAGSPWADYQSPAPAQTDAPQAQPAESAGPWSDYKPDPGMFNTVSDNAVQGATFGLGNRAEAGLAALALSAMNDKGLSQNYSDARNYEQGQLKNEMQQHPVASVLSNVGGALATGGLASDTAAGSALANSLRSGGLGARVAKGAVAGAASGAAYGAGTADDGKALEGAEQGAKFGALTGGAVPAVGAALSDVAGTVGNAARGLLARSPEAVQNAAQSLKQGASDVYNQMRQVGATFNPQASQKLLTDIKSNLQAQDFLPSLNPKTLGLVNDLDNIVAQAGTGGNLQLSTLDQIRRQLGRIGPTEDGVSAGKIRDTIDDFVNNAGQKDLSSGTPQAVGLLNDGRKQYSQASKFEDISDVLTAADGDPNKIKSGLTRFLNNDRNTRGWTPEELDALKTASSNSTSENLLKMFGKFGIDFGSRLTPGNTVAPLVGASLGGAIAPVVGTAARVGQKLTARGKAESLLNTLSNGGQAVSKTAPVSPLLSAPAGGAAALTGASIQQPSQGIPQMMVGAQTPVSYERQVPQGPDVSSFVKAESGGNPNAQNPNSSASGLYQFTNKTWADMVNKYGSQTGIKLSDKADPQAQATMARLYAQDNIKSLQNTLGRLPSKGELYMAHVLGASGAAKLINADPNKEAIMLFPRQVFDANRNIFFNGKQPRSAGEVYDILQKKVS